MIMKKNGIICIILAFVFAVSLFSVACNKGGKGGGNVKEEESSVDVKTGDEIKAALSDYSIVIAQNSTPAENYAANELKDFLLQATGVNLPIINDGLADTVSKYFVIGGNYLSQRAIRYDLSTLETDGFVIETHNDSFYISGKNGSGTLYGVYEFLERVVGIRFLTDECTYVPKIDDLSLYELEIVSNPVIEKRYFFGKSVSTGDSLKYDTFLARCRMMSNYGLSDALGGTAGYSQKTGMNHNITTIVLPKDQYGAAHPEWYSKMGGDDDICWTNGLTEDNEVDEGKPDSLFLTVLENMKSFVRAEPNAKYFMFGHGDFNLGNGCQCEQCLKLKAKYGYAGRQIRFANRLAEELNKWSTVELDREVYVVVWAYLASNAAPVTQVNGEFCPIDETVRANDHVVIYYAPISVDRTYSLTDAEHQTPEAYIGASQWLACASNIMIWDYETNFYNYMTYIPRIQTYKENVQLFAAMGAKYLQAQSCWDGNNIWYNLIEKYVAAKVYWDPTVDANALKEEFIRLYYGPAAETVMNVITTYEEQWFTLVAEGKIKRREYTELSSQIARYYGKLILRFISDLEKAIADVKADNTLTDGEKSEYADRLSAMVVTFKTLELIDYSAYHDTSLVGRYELALEIKEITERLNIERYREVLTFDSLLTQYLN